MKLSTTTILGKKTHERVIEEQGTCRIPLPEGNYIGEWTRDHYATTYNRWPGKAIDKLRGKPARRPSTYSIDVLGGIPVKGKGSMAHNVGMDGVFGVSGNDRNLAAAIASYAEAVMRCREKYGGPHDLDRPMTVSEASNR